MHARDLTPWKGNCKAAKNWGVHELLSWLIWAILKFVFLGELKLNFNTNLIYKWAAQVWNTASLKDKCLYHISDMNFNYKPDRWISRTSIRSLIGKCVYYISLEVSSVTCKQILEINLYTMLLSWYLMAVVVFKLPILLFLSLVACQ